MQDTAQEVERNKARAEQRQVRPSTQLLLSPLPCPVQHHMLEHVFGRNIWMSPTAAEGQKADFYNRGGAMVLFIFSYAFFFSGKSSFVVVVIIASPAPS